LYDFLGLMTVPTAPKEENTFFHIQAE